MFLFTTIADVLPVTAKGMIINIVTILISLLLIFVNKPLTKLNTAVRYLLLNQDCLYTAFL